MTETPQSPAFSRELHHLLAGELSLSARLGYVALLLAALTMTVVIGSLWLTEPMLPTRTHVAFVLMVAIGCSWVVFALRVLRTRRILLGRHRVVAGRMAVVFTGAFMLGSVTIGYAAGSSASLIAAGVGLVMFAVAVILLVRAHRQVARLTARRDALEHELARSATISQR
jgi:hypothetical protein